MICLHLFLLLLAVDVVRSDDYLIFATEDADKKTTFHMSDLNVENREELGTTKLPSTLDKLFISNHTNHIYLYWSYKNLNNIGCFQFGKKGLKSKCLKKDQRGTFIGFDSSNNLNFYFPESKTIDVINPKTEEKVKTLNGLKNINTIILRFMSRNPNNKDEAYFHSITKKKVQNVVVFDLEQDKIVNTYEISLQDGCIDALILTLNGDRSYCVRGNFISRSQSNLFRQIHYFSDENKIVHFAVGNDEEFYSTIETGKINKLRRRQYDEKIYYPIKDVYKISGTVTALFAFKSETAINLSILPVSGPADYLIFATEDADKKTTFHRSDLNVENSEELGTIKLPSTLDKLFINNDQVLYWSYKNLENVGCLQFGDKNLKTKCLKTNQKGTFIGFDSSNNLNFYFPESKTIDVINPETEEKVKTLNGLKYAITELRFKSRNPNNKDEAYFLLVYPTKEYVVAFNLEQDKVVGTYSIEPRDLFLKSCSDALILTLDGERSYCVKEYWIYRIKSFRHTDKFSYSYTIYTKKIEHFAVGNDEAFYSTNETRKIFKVTHKGDTPKILRPELTVHEVTGTVTALFAYKSGDMSGGLGKPTTSALASSLIDADFDQESHLIYSLESGVSLDFYMTNSKLTDPKKIFHFWKIKRDLSNLILSRDENGLNVYWSYKSPTIGRYQFSKDKTETKQFGEDSNIFLGVDYNEKIYVYSPKLKNIIVYDYDSGSKLQELEGLQNTNTDMHCVDVDLRVKQQIYFAECLDNKFTGKVYDIDNKGIQKDYAQHLPKCFDIWRITRNGQRVFAVAGNEIYLSAYEGAPYEIYHTAKDPIVGFAVENNVLYYSNNESKIFQITKYKGDISEKNIPVSGFVKVMAVYTPPKSYLIYATEDDESITFHKTDLDFKSSEMFLSIEKDGKSLDKMYLGFTEGLEVLYWTYKDGSNNYLGSYEFFKEKWETKQFSGDPYKIVGIGNLDKVYRFSLTSKTLAVNDLESEKESLLEGLKSSSTDLHCVDVDPRNREHIFFAECDTSANTGKVFDVKQQKVLDDYNQPLPVCFETWRITPNGKKAYAVHEKNIYLNPKGDASFEVITFVDENIETFAVGNNDLFYSNSKKIFKITPTTEDGYLTSDVDVKEIVKAMVVYEE